MCACAVDGLFYWCSGTLISNNAVLLAAHCVVNVVRSPVLWMDTFSFAPGARSGINPYGTATVKFVVRDGCNSLGGLARSV